MPTKLRTFIAGLALCMAGLLSTTSAQEEMKFDVKGENPGGKGGYKGEVTLSKLSKATAKVQWVTGPNNDITDGIAIRTGTAIGTAYGGEALYAMAVYELQGKTISAVWTTAANPAVSGSYVLKGTGFKGALPFADGTPGTVTFTPGEGGMYKVSWDIQAGHYEGVGVRLGDVLVAASGDPKGLFGVAAYQPKGDDIVGVWGTTQTPTAGKESWTLGESETTDAPAAKKGDTVEFGGDTYHLKENKSAPGQATSELREYLQEGEDWDGYRKMVALRMMNVNGASATTLAKATLKQVQQDNADAYVKEVKMEADSSTILFILVKDADVELNLWNYRKTASGIASAQFVFRNKPPYDTQKKFKSEQDANYVTWLEDLEKLATEAPSLIKATAGGGIASTSAPASTKPEVSDEELTKAIKVDIDKCAGIAKQFVSLIEEGNVADAADLMSDSSPAKAGFAKQLAKEAKTLGKLKDFSADKDATDFGVKKGLMTFTLEGDAKYENATVREVFTFVRDEGEIHFVGFSRKEK